MNLTGQEKHKTFGFYLFVLVSAILLIVLLTLAFKAFKQEKQVLNITSGAEEGTYYALGKAFAETLNKKNKQEFKVSISDSKGSEENIRRLSTGEYQLGFTQGNISPVIDGLADVRCLATLYEEILYILVKDELTSSINSLSDLEGLRVSAGVFGSGTRTVAKDIVEFLGLSNQNILPATNDIPREELLNAFQNKQIDAAFVVDSYGSDFIEELIMQGGARLLSLGESKQWGVESDAIAEKYPYYIARTIHKGTFSSAKVPDEAIRTISVQALLVASKDLPDVHVESLLSILFENRILISSYPGAKLAANFVERFEPYGIPIPYHPGAINYYNRNEPSFIVANAEFISLVMTLSAMAITSLLSIYTWLNAAKKNRVDHLLSELNSEFRDFQKGRIDREAINEKMMFIENKALILFKNEKLDVPSFRAFQSYFNAIERRIEKAGE